MTVQVDVLGRHPLPTVRVIVSGVPAGVAWELHGTSVDGEWFVASGVSTGGEVVTADPWAPLGVPASYRLTYGTTEQVDGPVVRRFAGRAALTDLSGRRVAEVLWMKGAGDPVESERRAHFSQVPGSRFAPVRLDPVAGVGGGSVTVRAAYPDAATLEDLLGTNRPLILLHNEERCQIRNCVVPPARTVVVTSATGDVTSRMDRGEREWSLTYRLMQSGVRDGVTAVVTLADRAEAFATLGESAGTGMDLGDMARGDWLDL